MEDLKNKTIIPDNIVFIDNYYWFVNHNDKLLTTGFKTKEKLIEYQNCIRFDKTTIELMNNRYNLYFNK